MPRVARAARARTARRRARVAALASPFDHIVSDSRARFRIRRRALARSRSREDGTRRADSARGGLHAVVSSTRRAALDVARVGRGAGGSRARDMSTDAREAVTAEWTMEALPSVLRAIVRGCERGELSVDDSRVARARLIEGASAVAAAEEDGAASEALGSVSRALCRAARVATTIEERSRWFGALVGAASTSGRALEHALEATRRAKATRGSFDDETLSGNMEIDGDHEDVILALVIVAGGRESARAIARRAKASDVERAVEACDFDSLSDLADFLISSLKGHDAVTLRAIACREPEIRIRSVIALLERVRVRVDIMETLIVLDELVQFDFAERDDEIENQVRRAIEFLQELSILEGENIALRAAVALSRIADAESVSDLFESDVAFSSVVGLRMFGEMMKSGRYVEQGSRALERALVDDRINVRREAFALTTALLNEGIFVSEATLNRAESEAKVDAILSISEILRTLSRSHEIPVVSSQMVQSLTGSLGLIFALDAGGKSVQNREIIRNTLRALSHLSACLIIQASSARDTDGEHIQFAEAESFEDAKDLSESRVLTELLPVVEVVLEFMLTRSKWFKEVLEQLENPKVDETDESSTESLESWITRLLFMHLQLTCGASSKAEQVSMLSIDSCSRLLSDEADWPEELERHITQMCANTLRDTHVSSFDGLLSKRHSALFNTCARRSMELLREDWFALRGVNHAVDPGSWSRRGTLEALRTFRAICEIAVSCVASSDPDLHVLQSLMRASFTNDELENASKSVVSFSKPHLGRKDYVSAGRSGKDSPVSGSVAVFVTSLHRQLLEFYASRDVKDTWDKVAAEVLRILAVLLPLTTLEVGTSELGEASVVMLEDAMIHLRDIPVELTCRMACVILQFYRRRFPLQDCVKTASAMLKIALSYSLTAIPDELDDLLRMINKVVSALSYDALVDPSVKQDAIVALLPVLVKTGDTLWRHVHSRQRSLDDIETTFVELGSLALDYCISAASELARTDGDDKQVEVQRRYASLVLAGARLHHCTDKMSRLYDTKLLGAFELKRRQFMVVCAGVFTNLRALHLLASKSSPLDRGLVAIGNALAMDDIENYAEKLSRLGESVQNVDGDVLQLMSNASSRENSASKPRKRIRNPYLDAVVAQEGGAQDDYDDMADFIVCKPGRDYSRIVGRAGW